MIVDILLWALVVSVLVQPTETRVYAAALFSGPAVLHGLLLGQLDGIAYYGSAAVVDLGVLWMVSRIAEQSRILLAIQRICVASIILNAIGWGMWALYLPPALYNTLFGMLYFTALIVLLQKDRADVGHNSMDRKPTGLRLLNLNRNTHLRNNGG